MVVVQTQQNLMGLIYQLAQAETQALNQQLKQLNLNNEQARALNYIDQHPGTNQRAVGSYLRRQAASTSNLIKRLLTQQLVVRQVAADNDREKQLHVTTAGEQVAQQIATAFTTVNRQMMQAVPVDQQTQLSKTLKLILQRLSRES